MTQYNMDSIFFRVERDGKWMNVCMSDMTEEELDRVLKSRDAEWCKTAIHHLCNCLNSAGTVIDSYAKAVVTSQRELSKCNISKYPQCIAFGTEDYKFNPDSDDVLLFCKVQANTITMTEDGKLIVEKGG